MEDLRDVGEKRKERMRGMVGLAKCWEKWIKGVNFRWYYFMAYQHTHTEWGRGFTDVINLSTYIIKISIQMFCYFTCSQTRFFFFGVILCNKSTVWKLSIGFSLVVDIYIFII